MTLALIIVLAACLAAAATDAASRRIPNAITIPLALAGLAWNAAHGWRALLAAIAIALALLVAGSAVHALGAIGGGDVKLIAAAAGTLNYPDALAFLLYTLVAGGVVAVIAGSFQGRLMRVLRSAAAIAASVAAGAEPPAPAAGVKVPYGIAIVCGAALVALSHTFVPSLRLPR